MLEKLLTTNTQKWYRLMLELSERKILSCAYIEKNYGWNQRVCKYHMRQSLLYPEELKNICHFKHGQLIYTSKQEISALLLLIRLLKNNTSFKLLRLLLEQKAYTHQELRQRLFISYSKLRTELLNLSCWLSNFHLVLSFSPYPQIVGDDQVMNWFCFVFCYFDAVNEDDRPATSLIAATEEESDRYLARFYELLEKERGRNRYAFFLYKQLVGCEDFLLNEQVYDRALLYLGQLESNHVAKISDKVAFAQLVARIETYYCYLAAEDLVRFKNNTPYEKACKEAVAGYFPCLCLTEEVNPELSKCYYHLLAKYIELPQKVV